MARAKVRTLIKDDAAEFFDRFAEETAMELVEDAYWRAAKAAESVVMPHIPVSFKKYAGSRVTLTQKGLHAAVGVINNGRDGLGAMKAYWKCYGTLDMRMRGHKFREPRKAKTARWTGGIWPLNFYEASEKTAIETFNSSVERYYSEAVESLE